MSRSLTKHAPQLALKHRQNKSQRQRIVVFVCSPIEEDESDLVKLAKRMKKNTVSVDFVLFGDVEDDTNERKLRAFTDVFSGSEGNNLIVIPPSGKLLSDQLISTPLLLGEGAAPSGAGGDVGGGAGGDFGEFGFDPSSDPELALALRMSMEEERARQEKKAREEEEAAKKTSLEAVPEEGESAPLLNKDGEASGSGSGAQDGEKKDGGKDADNMDVDKS
jgi:26S proteasome regulatory subunit N10